MEHAIGTIITLSDGRKAEVVESSRNDGCNGCIFNDIGYGIGCSCWYIYERRVICHEYYRTDHKNIIYKDIKEE